ncbi:MAG: LysR family transcriptional regulator [Oscillospiraceae bacterium]|jgi:DNA-binding transcriptional LysR family regulator
MDIQSLRYFICVGECLSFTRAAQLLFISQPALSNKIVDLENELGVSLFERTTRHVSFTPAGSYFFAEAKQLVQRMDELKLRVKGMHQGAYGRLSFGFLDVLAFKVVESTVCNFAERYPQVELQINKMTYSELVKAVGDFSIDLGFTINYKDARARGYINKKILTTKLMVLMRRDHPLAAQKSIRITELNNLPLLTVRKEDGATLINTITSLFAAKGLFPNYVGECRGPEELALSVSSGRGIAVVSYFLSSVLSYSSNLCMVPISHITTTSELFLIYNKDNPNPCIQSMLDTAQATAAELSEDEPLYILP